MSCTLTDCQNCLQADTRIFLRLSSNPFNLDYTVTLRQGKLASLNGTLKVHSVFKFTYFAMHFATSTLFPLAATVNDNAGQYSFPHAQQMYQAWRESLTLDYRLPACLSMSAPPSSNHYLRVPLIDTS